MRIFSKFHDYYDKALGYGIDQSVIYERKEEDITEFINKNSDIKDAIVQIHDNIFDFKVERINSPELQILFKKIILFCGRVYFCIEVAYKIKGVERYASTITEFVYSFDAFEKVVTKYSKIDLTRGISSGIFDGSRSKIIPINKRFKSLFDKQGAESDTAMLLHFELDSPIIVIDYDLLYTYVKKINVHKNKRLRDIEFYKAVNTFRAFQDLSMFISGVMGGKSPIMVEVSDKDRIAKHGFDKFSFRKEKEQ